MNNQFLFSYSGNKDREMNQILTFIPSLDNINIIIEPFGGSFSLIRHLYSQYPEKKFIVNDNDKKLIDIYEAMIDPIKNENIINDIKVMMENITKIKNHFNKYFNENLL